MEALASMVILAAASAILLYARKWCVQVATAANLVGRESIRTFDIVGVRIPLS